MTDNVDPTPEELDALLANNPWMERMGIDYREPEPAPSDDAYHLPGFIVLTCGEQRKPIVFSCLQLVSICELEKHSQSAQQKWNKTVITMNCSGDQSDGTWYVNQEFTEVLMLLKLAIS